MGRTNAEEEDDAAEKEDNTKEEGPLRAADCASLLQPIRVR